MPIYFAEEAGIFHLRSSQISYLMKILPSGDLAHLYWGPRLRKDADLSHLLEREERALQPYLVPGERDDFSLDRGLSLDMIPQEFPGYGRTDFRYPAYQISQEDGSRITPLTYQEHEIYQGKQPLPGLPATYVEEDDEAASLEILLQDSLTDLQVILKYSVYENLPVITRSASFLNQGSQDLKLEQALSAALDFNDDNFEMLQLSGAWSRERSLKRRPLEMGTQAVASKRGVSGPYQNPFLALLRPETTEHQGEVFGFSLIYSGNFLAQVEVNHFHQTRVRMGINPFDFRWLLQPGESFQTPEVVLVYADRGLNAMSQTFHQLYRTRLVRGRYRDQERPILFNNWEATYFDFDEKKLLELADRAAEADIELFVLDDGWFAARNDDTSSLGDWQVNREKLPSGLSDLGKKIERRGLKFGLWLEPEMVSPDSELYRRHPDWCLQVPDRTSSQSRNQLVLDFSCQDVRQEILERISAVLEKAPISYVKWDMNRHLTEIGSAQLPPERQQETAHRYILGLYHVLEELNQRFPDILFESCSSGGGRFDPGMLYYMPQTWTSDNTDAADRLKIQYGTSLIYPLSSMGAHVSDTPNHQVGRITPLKMRADVASFGVFGYELDITRLSEEEFTEIKQQVKKYRKIRHLIQTGTFYRLLSPFDSEIRETAWLVVSQDRNEAYVGYFRALAVPNPPFNFLKLKGLDPAKSYQLQDDGRIFGGDELMQAGLLIPEIYDPAAETPDSRQAGLYGDFQSFTWHLKEI